MPSRIEADVAPDVQALAQEYPDYVAALSVNRRWNFGVGVLDSSTFALTKAALTETTVLPYFVSQMTSNALVIGLSPAIAWLGLYLPQLFSAYLVYTLTRRKRYIVLMAWLERLGVLAMLAIALGIGRLPSGWVLAAFLLVYFAFWINTGLLVPPYSDFYAKHIPSGRGRFLGVQALLYGGMGVVGAGAVRWLLTGSAFPLNFVHVLAFALLSSLPALIAFHSLREVAFPIQHLRQPLGEFLRSTGRMLGAQPAFVRFLVVRAVLVFGKMGIPFLAIYALQRFALPSGMVATYTALMLAAQSVSAPVWGLLADRWHHQNVWLVAALVQCAQALLAWWAPAPGWFLLIFALVGVSLGAEATAHPNTTYVLSPGAETTRFIGLANSVLGPLLALGPLAGGALAGAYSYTATLAASTALAGAGVLAVLGWIVLERRPPWRTSARLI
jgi:MFS family permease